MNTTGEVVEVPIAGPKQGMISGKRYGRVLRLDAYGVDLLQ